MCVYGLNGKRGVTSLHWRGNTADFILLYEQLEKRRNSGRLAYAYAQVENGETVYEHGSAEDIEHAKTIYELSREDQVFKPRPQKRPAV